MLIELPIAILQTIHDSLPADDRIALRHALQKHITKYILYKNDLKCAILLKNIKNKNITKLTKPILKFIFSSRKVTFKLYGYRKAYILLLDFRLITFS